VPSNARADAAADDAETKMARTRFLEGVAFDDKGDFENARLSFLQAYLIKKHPTVLLNLAVSCAKGNHSLEASKYFRMFLHDSQNPPADKLRQAEEGLRDVRRKLGRVDVSAPTGAEVSVDGEKAGIAPLTDAVDVEPGARTISVRLIDGSVLSERATLVAGQRVPVRFMTRTDVPKADPPKVEPGKTDPPKVEPPKGPSDAVVPPGGGQVVGPEQPPPPSNKPGLFDPPATMVPVYVGLGVGVVGLTSTIIFAVAKGTAQTKVDQGEAQIRDRATSAGFSTTSICTRPPSAAFASACGTLKDNVSTVNTNAAVANVSAVFMTIGFVGAAGWYLFAPKKNATPAAVTARILPVPTTEGGSLHLVGTF
jgi:hypothetical protein